MANNLELCLTYFERGDFRLLIGKIHFIDSYKRELRIVDFNGDVFRIN
ncbi:YolD-like family protein [Fictibacillus solisalsi]|nr:YolD-like family protein [Fictibacillus solisalsi]